MISKRIRFEQLLKNGAVLLHQVEAEVFTNRRRNYFSTNRDKH